MNFSIPLLSDPWLTGSLLQGSKKIILLLLFLETGLTGSLLKRFSNWSINTKSQCLLAHSSMNSYEGTKRGYMNFSIPLLSDPWLTGSLLQGSKNSFCSYFS